MQGVNYKQYSFGMWEWLVFFIKYACVLIGVGYLFFDSVWAACLLIPALFYFYKLEKQEKIKKRKKQLNQEFKELLQALVTALQVGYSLENAFEAAGKDLALLYSNGKKNHILGELEMIAYGLNMNCPIEQLLWDFAKRSDSEDIMQFARMIEIGKRTGGNLIQIVERTGNQLTDKIEINEEIDTIISAKKLEQKIMGVMPVCILLYIRFANPGYVEILYHNPLGGFLMLLCLILTLAANQWAKRIVEIQV